LRPILMTTLATILGLVPMSLGIGEGAELQAPLARVVIGGLAASTLITLVFVPTVYTIFEEGWKGLRSGLPKHSYRIDAQIKKLSVIIILLAAIGGAGGAYYMRKGTKEPEVRTAQISRGDIIDAVQENGTLEAVNTV